MNIINHSPLIKVFGNGFQITFPNRYSIIVKNGLGAKCTQAEKSSDDTASLIMSARFGGTQSPDCEVEIFNAKKENVSSNFGGDVSLSYVTPFQLANLFYVISGLK
jgi:hypothetical protein